MKKTLFFFLLCIAGQLFAQRTQMMFQHPNQLRNPLRKINRIHIVEKRAFTVIQQKYESNRATRNELIEIDGNGALVANIRFKRDADGDRMDLVGIDSDGTSLYAFYEKEEGDRSTLYRAKINLDTYELMRGKKKVMSGEKNPVVASPLIDLNPVLDIDYRYFERRLYAMVEFDQEGKVLFMRREPNGNNEEPRLMLQLYDENLELLLEGKIKLEGTNKRTTIEDIEVSEDNVVYFLTSYRDGGDRDYTLSLFDPAENDDRNISIKDNRYIQKLAMDVSGGGVMIAGMVSDKRSTGKWQIVASPVDLDRRTLTSFKTLRDSGFDRGDEIEIRRAGNSYLVIGTSFRPSANSGSDIQRGRSGLFTERRTEETEIIAIDDNGDEKWSHLIPNFIDALTIRFESFELGYDDIKFDNYAFIEHKDRMSVLYCMNPLNDRKPRKNGRMRAVVTSSTNRFGVKRVTFDQDGLVDQKIIWENQRRITPIPYFTTRLTGDSYLMYGSTFRFGGFSFAKLDL